MRFVIVGGLGFIGRNLSRYLCEVGHEVFVTTRRKRVKEEGCPNIVRWRVLEEHIPSPIKETDVLVNLAGENIFSFRWSEEKKRRIVNSRVGVIEKLVHEYWDSPPSVFLQASAVGYYGDRGDEKLTESSQKGEGFLADTAELIEKVASSLEPQGTRVVLMRLGLVLGRDGGLIKQLRLMEKTRMCFYIKHAYNWWSWIHIHDVSRAIAYLVENKDISGPVNITAEEPERMIIFMNKACEAMKTKVRIGIPRKLVLSFMGEMAKEGILSSQYVYPQRLVDSGFKYEFPEINLALEDIFKKP